MSRRWHNWARTATSRPIVEVSPKTIEQTVRAVTTARRTGRQVKAIGASHSFNAIGATDGIRIHLSKLRGLVDADLALRRVTVWAGTHLWEIPNLLAPLGLALENMGDIDRQTIAGATQTGTHGTGIRFGSFSTQIVALTLVTGTGDVRKIDETEPALLRAAALGLGALGILIDVTLQCVPHYRLRAEEEPAPLDSVLESFSEIARASDHFEFFWFPHTSTARIKRNTRIGDAPTEPLSAIGRFTEEELMNNALLGALTAFESVFPRTTPALNRLVQRVGSSRAYSDDWNRVFVSTRRVKFRETEYGVPLAAVPEVMGELRSMIIREQLTISFPIEVRVSAADSLFLSPAYGRETAYIALHQYIRDDYRQYFSAVHDIMQRFDARPHWGKMHALDEARVRDLYPEAHQFYRARDLLDPDRVFLNDHLRHTIGP